MHLNDVGKPGRPVLISVHMPNRKMTAPGDTDLHLKELPLPATRQVFLQYILLLIMLHTLSILFRRMPHHHHVILSSLCLVNVLAFEHTLYDHTHCMKHIRIPLSHATISSCAMLISA